MLSTEYLAGVFYFSKKGSISHGFDFNDSVPSFSLISNIRCFKIDQPSSGDASGAPAVWSHGYTEASGVKNKWVQLGREKHLEATPLLWWERHTVLPTLGLVSQRSEQDSPKGGHLRPSTNSELSRAWHHTLWSL